MNKVIKTNNETKEKQTKEEKKLKVLTILIVTFLVLLLLFGGYSFAKNIEETIIKANTIIAEPILEIENNPSININATENTGTYIFKVKNYNENQTTQVDLKYYIEILNDVDKSIQFELYENEKLIDFDQNKTDYRTISQNVKNENIYKLVITYDKNKALTMNDIVQQIQLKIHTEQVKG